MDKENILAKSRAENYYQDEREKLIARTSMAYGAIGMAIMLIILVFVQFFSHNGTTFGLFALYTSFFAVSYLYRYKLLRDKMQRNMAIFYTLVALVWLMLYIWKG